MSNLSLKPVRDVIWISVGTTVRYARFMMIKVKKSRFITVRNVAYAKLADVKTAITAMYAIYVIKVLMQVDILASKID